MKHRWFEKVAVIVMSCVLVICCSISSFAFDSGRTLESGTWKTLYNEQPVKISVPGRGYIKVSYTGQCPTSVDVYNSKKVQIDSIQFDDMEESYCRVPVVKGEYYLMPEIGWEEPIKLKYTFHANKSKGNTTKKKAIKLRKNKYVTDSLLSYGSNNPTKRWYKIKIGSKQRITLKTHISGAFFACEAYEGHLMSSKCIGADEGTSVYLYNSKGKIQRMKLKKYYSNNTISATSKYKLPKGTYYVCVKNSWSAEKRQYSNGNVVKVKWLK